MKYFLTAVFLTLLSFNSFAQNTYWWNDRVFYEIFVRSFYDSNGNGIGDFKGLTQKLDYLNDGNPATTTDLGITGIWLMPIMQSPSYHGYDVTDYKTIEQDYGTNADFKEFLAAAHQRGIKVIIDFVINHSSSQHPWFQNSRSGTGNAYRNWYRWNPTNPGYLGPWGQTVWHNYNNNYYYGLFNGGMPDINHFELGVQNELNNISKFWLDTIKVDGFRLDAARYICEEGSKLQEAPSTFNFWRDFRMMTKSIKSDALNVGEVWAATSIVLPYVDGTGLDFCFEFDLATDIINSVNRGNPSSVITKMNSVVSQNYPFLQYGTFLTNHDQVRVFSQLAFSNDKAKLAASVIMTLPGIPFMYYGEELGMTSAGDDPSKRTPMQWTPGTNSGFTTGNPWKTVNPNYSTNNVETMSADNSSLLNHYKKLIKIRNENAALRTGKYYQVNITTPGVYIFGRNVNNSSEIIYPVLNFSPNAVSNPNFYVSGYSGIPTGLYKLTDMLTNANAGELLIQPNGAYNCTINMTIPGYGAAILKASKITEVNDNNVAVSFSLEQNYPNPFNPSTKITFQLPESGNVKLTVYNTLGQEVRTILNEYLPKGYHSADFDGTGLNSGVYIYKLQAGRQSQIRKMILLK